jgi:hypothetical protein
MLLEVEMEVVYSEFTLCAKIRYFIASEQGPNCTGPYNVDDGVESTDSKPGKCACIVQYVLFPPHNTVSSYGKDRYLYFWFSKLVASI